MPSPYEGQSDEALEQLWGERIGREKTRMMDRVTIQAVDQDEHDDMLANTLLAQERDLAAHRLNLERFEAILGDMPPGPTRHHYMDLLLQTLDRGDEVTRIIDGLTPQLPPQARLDDAVARIKQREAQARGDTTP